MNAEIGNSRTAGRWVSLLARCRRAAPIVLVGLAFEANAQSADLIQVDPLPQPAWADRDLGDLRTWLNISEEDRVPIGERPLIEVGRTNRVFLPPRTRRDGFVPRLTVGVDGRRNVFFTDDNRESDVAGFVSPGLSFVRNTSRGFVWADYSFESALFLENENLNDAFDAQQAFLFGAFELTRRTSVEFIDVFQDSQDPTLLPIPGAVPAGERTRSNDLGLTGRYSFDALTEAEAIYRNRLEFVDTDGSIDVMVQDGEFKLARRLSPQNEVEAIGRFRHFDFDPGGDDLSYAGFLGFTHEFSETLIATTRLGGAYTDADDGRSFVVGGAGLSASFKNAVFSFSYDRDVTATTGIGSVLLSDLFSGQAAFRLAPGLQAGATVDYQLFDPLNDTDAEVDIVDASGQLSYAVRDNVWLRLRFSFVNQDLSGQDSIDDQRLILSVTGSL